MKMNSPLRLFVLLVLLALCVLLVKESIRNTASIGNTTVNVTAHIVKESGYENKTEQPCPGGKDDCDERGYVRIGTGDFPKVHAKSLNRSRRQSRRGNGPIDWYQPNSRILGKEVRIPYRAYHHEQKPGNRDCTSCPFIEDACSRGSNMRRPGYTCGKPNVMYFLDSSSCLRGVVLCDTNDNSCMAVRDGYDTQIAESVGSVTMIECKNGRWNARTVTNEFKEINNGLRCMVRRYHHG
ncbi:hypothetical protein V3C99_014374 [Haemonchus contortus]